MKKKDGQNLAKLVEQDQAALRCAVDRSRDLVAAMRKSQSGAVADGSHGKESDCHWLIDVFQQ